MIYEYELVYQKQVSGYLQKGWEPVPDVQHVIDLEMRMTYVFLRRSK